MTLEFLIFAYIILIFIFGVRITVWFMLEDMFEADESSLVLASILGLIGGLIWPLTILVFAVGFVAKKILTYIGEEK